MALTTKGIRFSQTTADCSPHSNASLILLYNCPNFRYFSTKKFYALEFAKINIFGIGIHHTSLLGILFAWTLSVLTLIFVKATREAVIGDNFRELYLIAVLNRPTPRSDYQVDG